MFHQKMVFIAGVFSLISNFSYGSPGGQLNTNLSTSSSSGGYVSTSVGYPGGSGSGMTHAHHDRAAAAQQSLANAINATNHLAALKATVGAEVVERAKSGRDASFSQAQLEISSRNTEVALERYSGRKSVSHIESTENIIARAIAKKREIKEREQEKEKTNESEDDFKQSESSIYHFRSEGEFRNQLNSTYQDLLQANPSQDYQKTARGIGLSAVEEADCLYSLGDQEQGVFFHELSKDLLDIAINLSPIASFGRGAYELITGTNMLTGEELGTFERGLAATSVLSLGGSGTAKSVLKFASKLPQYVRSISEASGAMKYGKKVLDSAGKLAHANPELGRKLDYVLGKATGSAHNIERSQEMLRQMERIGLPDTQGTRTFLSGHLKQTLETPSSILKTQENGRIVRESLLTGPRGVVKVESIWQDARLITIKIFGGGN